MKCLPGGMQLSGALLTQSVYTAISAQTQDDMVRAWTASAPQCDQGVSGLTCMCIGLQGIQSGSIERPLIEESREFLAQTCERMFSRWTCRSSKTALEPDVSLKLADDMLPAHRSLLPESSKYFEAMFQASFHVPRDAVGKLVSHFKGY